MKLELYYPVSPFKINQNLGDNYPCVEKNYAIPLQQRKVISGTDNKTCPVGYEKLYPLLGLQNGHNGTDLLAGEQPIYSSQEGIVTEMQTEAARGLGVGVTTENKYEVKEGEYQIKLRYWHLKSISVKPGQKLKIGDLIGISDSTGYSSGNHLHFECKPQKINSNGEYENVFQMNGYFGSIDPVPYFSGKYAHIGLTFNVDMFYLQYSDDIRRLQAFLKDLGYFPQNQECTGLYRNITRNAVYHFQLDHVKLTPWETLVLAGKTVGPKTRAVINNLVN